VVGDTVIVEPVAIAAAAPEQILLLYHTHCAAVPKDPPFTLKLVEEPAHIVSVEEEAEVAPTEGVATFKVALTQAEVLQVPAMET
jgi:hypothetical protein